MRWIFVCSFLVLWRVLLAQEQLPSHDRLLELCSANDYKTLGKLLNQHSADAVKIWLSTPASDGCCPLHTSVKKNCIEITRLLLNHKANVDHARRSDGRTPLILAVIIGSAELVELLLNYGANPDKTAKPGTTPLYYAVQGSGFEIIKLLLANRADPNVAPRVGITPLYLAVANGQTEILRLLIENGANPNPKPTSFVETPLLTAARNGDLDTARLLLDNRNDPNFVASGSETPLYIAAFHGYTEMVHLLLENRADPNLASGNGGRTPLWVAVYKGYSEIVRLLLENRADPNLTSDRETPLFTAARRGHLEIVRLLSGSRADPNIPGDIVGSVPLHVATLNGHTLVVDSLLKSASVSPVTSDANTPLHLAVKEAQPVMVTLLLLAGADPSLQDGYGSTAFSIPYQWKRPLGPRQQAVAWLLRGQQRYRFVRILPWWLQGPNVYGEDSQVHEAIRMGCSELAPVDILDLQAPRLDGCTPLHLAVLHRNRAAVAQLVIRGVELSPINLQHETPLQLALQDDYEPIVSVLGPAVIAADKNTNPDSSESDQQQSTDRELLSNLPVFSLQDWTANALRGWLNIHETKTLFEMGILPLRLSILLLGTRHKVACRRDNCPAHWTN